MGRGNKVDDQLLDERISSNHLEYPQQSLLLMAVITSFQPIYYSHAINGLEWSSPANAVMYIIVTAGTVYMLRQAYSVMVESEFWSRQRHYSEVDEGKESVLRRLRLQVSLGYTLFFINALFFLICACMMAYIFRTTDPRAAYILSPPITAALLWMLAQRNEDARQRRLRVHK